MQPLLVVLAAGMGRRFGGDKQVAGIGPGGRPLLAYALHDAHRAGFSRAIVVIRDGLERPLRTLLADASLPVEYALQARDREHPWGTGHAVLAAAPLLDRPFMIVNADDFYGAGTYEVMGRFLREVRLGPPPAGALATFALADTLSVEGPVNRGICRPGQPGWLAEIEEVRGIPPDGGGWPAGTAVSLNAWGFTPALLPLLADAFADFRETAGPEAEFMLPTAVNRFLALGQLEVRMLAAPGPWIGITWPGDLPRAAAHLARILEAGEYPAFR